VTSTAQTLHPLPWGQLSNRRLDSLRLWQMTLGHGRLPALRIRRDPVPAEGRFRELLTEKGEQAGTMALALEFPFDVLPPCQRPESAACQQAVRTYLDHLLAEAATVGRCLQNNQTVSHLYWLGDPTRWLSKGELTELMYRLGQYFHLRRDLCHCAVIEMQTWSRDKGLYALLRGLGFSHLLINSNLGESRSIESATREEIRQYWESLNLTPISRDPSFSSMHRFRFHGDSACGAPLSEAELASLLEPPRNLLIGLGVGAWSVIDHQMLHNASRLDVYYGRISGGRLPTLEAGTWQHSQTEREQSSRGGK